MPFSPQEFSRKEEYTFEDLLALVRFLRSPEGCSWDRVQTHASVRHNLLEEAYEVAEGIDADDPAILREELGDFLFQAAFHTVIEEEQGRSTAQDVLRDICKKMVNRHPHLFAGGGERPSSSEVPARWEEIKRNEKGQRSVSESIKALPKTLPALMYAQKVAGKAARADFTYENADEAMDKVVEEWHELAAAKTQKEREEELGDMLFALANYARFWELDAEEALEKAAKKFCRRFASLEENLALSGREMATCTKNDLLFAWNEQKNTEKSTKIAKI
jgi:tetrapyrrole methylase family protein/MazG family protein